MDLGPGTLIGGRYRLEHLLGKGGMGEVWAAKHQVTRRDVALKFLTGEHGTMPQMRRRFLREARAAAAVAHPNVIHIHDVFELEDETPVMVMDLLSGEALSDKLARSGALTVEETAQIMGPVVSAVGTAHALGIVHRDLKPENIFLARSGEGEVEVKVLDFGIAKLAHAIELDQTGAVTGTGAVLGTPYYMALEQAYGEKDIDHRADIWSLGVVLYECLAGRRPIEGDNFGQIVKFLNHGTIPPLGEVAPHVPADLAQLVARMLERAREDRPQDLREVLAVLRRYTASIARTFGAPQAPQRSGVHEALDVAAPTARASSRASSSMVSGEVPTIEVITSNPPESKPAHLRVSTGKRASPADVTLAEGGSALAAPAPPPAREGTRRPALIAGAGVVAGIALTAGVVLTFSRGPRAVATPSAQPVAASAVAPAITAPPSAEPPKATAQPVATSASAAPTASVTAEPSSEPAPSTAVKEPRAPKSAPVATARPSVSSAASAQPVAPVAPTPQPKGGLVDEPPF
jgi:serine/threonine-protein kinase